MRLVPEPFQRSLRLWRMMEIGFHASHEQFSPGELLELVQVAEGAGFNAAMSSDHLAPWSRAQGQSGFAWSWLGAAMARTRLPFGSLALPGNWRYHPVVLAQAVATLAQMFPNRFKWIAAGSGEALNEAVIGRGWPDKGARNARLMEGVDIMRALWRGEIVHRPLGLIPTEKARLWTLPEQAPKICGAALSPETAEWMGGWADGLLTVHKSREEMQKMFDAFRRGGGGGKPVYVQVHVSWDETDEAALHNAHQQWHSNVITSDQAAGLRTPEDFEAATAHVKPEDMHGTVLISADPAKHVAWLKDYLNQGAAGLFVHNAGRNQKAFLETYKRDVLPEILRG